MSGKALEDFKTSTIPSCYPIPSAQQFFFNLPCPILTASIFATT